MFDNQSLTGKTPFHFSCSNCNLLGTGGIVAIAFFVVFTGALVGIIDEGTLDVFAKCIADDAAAFDKV